MEKVKHEKVKLLVTDIDNTVFDWVAYYANGFTALLQKLEAVIGVPFKQLADESRVVFARHGSIEYPFVVQELPSVNAYFGDDIDRMLVLAVDQTREVFKEVSKPYLKPYEGVEDALKNLHHNHPELPIVALTDAPRYVAMWKLNKLGLLHYFSAVYGLADPRLPTSETQGRVKVDPRILLKHLQQNNFAFKGKIRILPDEYEKPGTRGLKTVLMDFELDEPTSARRNVLWVGDNLRKDVGLGRKLGVQTAWAEYVAVVPPVLLKKLHEFSPLDNVHKNASIDAAHADSPKPDVVLNAFADLTKYL